MPKEEQPTTKSFGEVRINSPKTLGAIKHYKSNRMNLAKRNITLALLIIFVAGNLYAQQDTLFIKANQRIICTQLSETSSQYHFNYKISDSLEVLGIIPKYLVDSVKYSKINRTSVNHSFDNIKTSVNSAKPVLLKKDTTIRLDTISLHTEKASTKVTLITGNISKDYATTPLIKTSDQQTDTIKISEADTSVSVEKKSKKKSRKTNPVNQADTVQAEKPWNFKVSYGINLGSLLEINSPTGSDKKNFTFNSALDLGLNYRKEGRKFEMTNELHYLLGLQKEGLSSTTHIQRVQDQLETLHDFSESLGRNNVINFNTIVKISTSLLTVYNGDYLKDFNHSGRIQAFANPYNVIISPGMKIQPNPFLRVSLSPYSINLYGIKDMDIADKGIYITEIQSNGKYKQLLFKRLGAEVNFWYDRRVKDWVEMQYRLSFSSDYFANFGKNGTMDGLFFTKIKIVKNIYLTHQATLKSNLAVNFLKPYYNHMILLGYSKSF